MEYGKLINERLIYVRTNKIQKDGMIIYNPSESMLNSVGIYRVVKIADYGKNVVENNIIKYYIGKPVQPNEGMSRMINMNARLEDMTELTAALERIIAQLGVTEEDKAMAQERIALRDELGKAMQTEEGTGTLEDPYKGWKVGDSVEAGKWYQTEDGYLWEAIKSGMPASSTDKEYFDVV